MNAKSILINLIRRSNYALPPHKIAVEITQDCNLNCPMCPRQFNKITGENMSVEKFRHILDQLPMLRYVHIIGQGEPFMHPNIFEILNLHTFKDIDGKRYSVLTAMSSDKFDSEGLIQIGLMAEQAYREKQQRKSPELSELSRVVSA